MEVVLLVVQLTFMDGTKWDKWIPMLGTDATQSCATEAEKLKSEIPDNRTDIENVAGSELILYNVECR